MDKLSTINFVVAAIVCATIVGINIVAAIAQSSGEGIYRILHAEEYPGTTWTLRLWGMWWLAIFFTYLGIDKYHYSYSLIFSSLGDICTLGAAVAYCTGQCHKKMIFFLGGVFVLELIWDIAMPAFFDSPQGRILVVAPSTVISIISIVGFGWAVVVRCGWTALPFLFLTAVYALAQLPAYFDKIVLGGNPEDILRTTYFNKLYLAFVFLAVGKVFYALAFFGYFFSPTQTLEALKHPKYFPSGDSKAKMDPKYAQLFRWTVIVVSTSFITTFVAATVPGFINWVKELFRLQ